MLLYISDQTYIIYIFVLDFIRYLTMIRTFFYCFVLTTLLFVLFSVVFLVFPSTPATINSLWTAHFGWNLFCKPLINADVSYFNWKGVSKFQFSSGSCYGMYGGKRSSVSIVAHKHTILEDSAHCVCISADTIVSLLTMHQLTPVRLLLTKQEVLDLRTFRIHFIIVISYLVTCSYS